MIKIIAIVGLAVLAGVLYHAGGQGQKMFRRAGVPILCYFPALVVLFGWSGWLWYFISAGLLAFALTSYWDTITKLWRGDEKEYWENWLLHGLINGLAAIPLLLSGIPLWAIMGRAIVLAGLTTWVSERSGKVLTEEFWRGFFVITTLFILKI